MGYKYREFRAIRRYMSASLVRESYLRRHSLDDVQEEKIRSIVSNIKQAQGLFESARRSDHLTRPIEQYYGILAYTRAMLMFTNSEVRESGLIHSHGLKIAGISGSTDGINSILKAQIKTAGGFFLQWARNQSAFVLRSNSNIPNFQADYDGDLSNLSCSFVQLLALLPDIWDELRPITKDSYIGFIIQRDKGASRLSIEAKGDSHMATPEYVSGMLGNINVGKIHSTGNNSWQVDVSDCDNDQSDRFQLVQSDSSGFQVMGIGDALFVPQVISKKLNPMAVMMMVAYTMSMLSRYRPSIWGRIWESGNVDAGYPLMEGVMDLIQNQFPLFFISNLEWVSSE